MNIAAGFEAYAHDMHFMAGKYRVIATKTIFWVNNMQRYSMHIHFLPVSAVIPTTGGGIRDRARRRG